MAALLMSHFMLAAALVLTMSITSVEGLRHHLLAGAPNATEDEEFLSSHNATRGAVGVPPLRWSPKLARMASRLARYQRDKKNCGFANLTSGKFGSNQAWQGEPPASTPRRAVEVWVAMKEWYDPSHKSCGLEVCEVYLQVVWRKTLELGCKQIVCRKDTVSGLESALDICLYNPRGNIKGEIPY